MPSPRPGRRLLAALLTAALPALLTGLLPVQALAVGGNLNTSAFLESRGWINPALVPPPANGSAAAPGALASEAWYVAPPGLMTPPPPWQVGAAGFARAEVLSPGTGNASVQQGTAALARAVANATGRAEATLSAQWRIDVVINPLQVPLIGPGLYSQLMATLGCPIGTFLSQTDCSGPERGFSFLHLTQGAFQVTPGQPTGRASFEETATLASRSNIVSLQGGASFSADRPAGSLGITWSGGWSDADAAVMPLHDGTTARLFPAGDPRNELADPFGALTGVRLEALRPMLVSSGFQVGFPHYFGSEPLPFARFTFDLEQVARAGWAFGYGFGTVAANFDDTAVTRLLGIEGLTLSGPDGEPVPLAGLLQVHMEALSPVPEPATVLLFALGSGLLWARARRWAGVMPRLRWMRGLGLGSLLLLGAAAQAAPPPGWAPAQVTLRGTTVDGQSHIATGTIANPADRVEIAPVSASVVEDLGSSYTWRNGTAMAGEVFSASGYDWRQPVSVVPEPASAAMALLGIAVLMAARRRQPARAWALPVLLVGWLGAAAAAPGGAALAEVMVNGRALDAATRQAVESRTGVPLQPGRWWYDPRSGLWGAEGQGAAGVAPAGIDVGAPLPPQASGGRAGVFFNGRSLADAEIAWLQTLGPVWPGRYWLDAMGNVGLEGQALPFANLVQLAQAQAPRSGRTAGGSVVASDGRCVYVSGRSSSGIGSFGASNC